MISAALDDSVRKLWRGFRKDRTKRTMLQDKLNEVLETVNVIVEHLDGDTKHKAKEIDGKQVLIKSTFIGKKLDYLELDFLDEEGEA